MLKVLILSLSIVSSSYGSPVDKIEGKTNSTIPVANKILQTNVTKMPVVSEGGAIISNMPALSLPKENQAFLMTSPGDTSSNKIKPRKGAPAEVSGNISIEQSPINNVDQEVKNIAVANITINDTKLITNTSLSTPSPIIKKPTMVSAELIEKADLLNSDPVVGDEERMIKIHKTSSNGHPGMITPIIITVLVVPIFAMVGYMALKRGQEAWKNRHYKRMDFLLDGMYND